MNLSIVCWFRTYAVPGILYYIAKLGGSRILHPLKLATVFSCDFAVTHSFAELRRLF
jgi:hypothetical protein